MKYLSTLIVILFVWGQAVAQGILNQSDVNQVGDLNTKDIIQNDFGNEVFIDQAGDNNDAEIFQHGSHTAYIEQISNHNSAVVSQEPGTSAPDENDFPPGNPQGVPFGESGSSTAFISQDGNDNHSEIEQTGSHEAEIYQHGDNNLAEIFQTGPGSGNSFAPPGNPEVCPPPFAPCENDGTGSEASIAQEGNENQAFIYQSGADHFARIQQKGHQNKASITQRNRSDGPDDS